MIDAFYIFTKGGLLLWSVHLVKVKGNPLDRLIKNVLMEERAGETFASLDSYNLKWKILNEMDVLLVVVYQGILQLAYLEELLNFTADEFLEHYAHQFGVGLPKIKHVDFDENFTKIRRKADKLLQSSKRPAAMKTFDQTAKGVKVQKNKDEKGISTVIRRKGKSGGEEKNNNEDSDGSDDPDAVVEDPAPETVANPKALAKMKSAPFKKKEKEPKDEDKTKKGKEARKWEDGKVSKKDMESLWRGPKAKDDDPEAIKAKQAMHMDLEDDGPVSDEEIESVSSGSDEELEPSTSRGGTNDPKASNDKEGRVGGLFKTLTRSMKSFTGGAVLTDEDLRPILQQFKTALMTKNVAVNVAGKLADSVRLSLVGKRTDRFTSMTATVKSVLYESIETVLTPKKSIDVLKAAMDAKKAGRVYSIAFLGVNGVGKSTNLAKVAYYLKNKGGLDVLICACDTFRAGAVEQLKTHANCLDIPLFERGYGRDPAEIAKAALAHAKTNHHDVVLIDTAGRMQDNEPLMRALAKLVAVNNPDLVLFVGEALVGNDAIDQVTKFNRSLVDMSHDRSNPHGIDGMLLTKYDTVDDKVGAALSLVYMTGQPIVFVGTGQKYTHLRKMQAKEVVKTLMG